VASHCIGALIATEQLSARLTPWLSARLSVDDVTVTDVRRHDEGFSWGTFTLDAHWREPASGRERSQGLAVRLEPVDGLLGPYDVSHEVALHQVVQEQATVPIPRWLWTELDPSWLGSPFYVMERVRAEVPVQWRPDDPVAFPTPAARRAIGLQFVDIQAAVHAIDWRGHGTGVLDDPGPPERAARVEVERWVNHYEHARLVELPMVREAINWLRLNITCSGRLVLCHGDYRLGNFMLRDGRIVAVLDWELAHVGDPIEDIAYSGLPLWRGHSPLLSRLLAEDEYFARYEERTGLTIDAKIFRFWTVLGLLKATASHVRACRAFEDGGVTDLRLAAMDHRTIFVLRHLQDALEVAQST
jgi:aminoglycoside phosphotransferase (APT) family kinase protein